ncbi:MAG: fibrinogen-like YCDxxxxGGGW domain-containing protein [Myxococcota bacterium]
MSRLLTILSVIFTMACDSDKGVTAFNSKPVATITSHSDGDTVLEGFVTTFRGSASDPNHRFDQLTATWFVDAEVLCDARVPESDGTVQCEGVLPTTGSTVTLEVKDAGNATASAAVALVVEPTAAPQAEIHSPLAAGVYYSDQKIVFSGILSDAEDAASDLVGDWSSDLDGLLSEVVVAPNSDGETEGFGYLSEGQHAIQLTVEDTTGKTDSASVVVEVGPPNSAPLCQIITPQDGSVGTIGDVVSFTAQVSDVDIPSDWLTVSWSSDKDNALGESTPTSAGDVSFSYSDLTVNTHNIVMTVTDEMGETCTAAIDYTVGTPPQIAIHSPIDGEVYSEGQPIDFAVSVSDLQDQPDHISLDWVIDGALFSNQGPTSSGNAQFSTDELAYGVHTLLVTATDTDGLTDADQITFTVNGLPSTPTISLSPDPATTVADLTAVIDVASIDPEGSTVTYGYVWLKDNVVQTTQLGPTVVAANTAKGEVWAVQVTPNDGWVDGPVAEASIVIDNTPPTVSGAVISPATAIDIETTLTCSGTAQDPDEVPAMSYQWLIGTTVVGSGIALDLATLSVAPLDQVTCLVTATDGSGATDTASATVAVDNIPPTVINLTLLPSMVATNDVVSASVSFADFEGQAVTAEYEWFVVDFLTGTTSLVQFGNNSALNGVNHFDRDDQVYVVVTPNDGIDDGPSETSPNLTIVNTAPTTPSIQLLPDPADVGQDDLICMVDVPSVDDDGDAIFYTYEWTDSSGVIQQSTIESVDLSDAFPAALTSAGIWTCEVTPFDGTDDGGTAVVTAEVLETCSSWEAGIGDHVLTADAVLPTTWTQMTLEGWFKINGPGNVPCYSGGNAMNTLMDTVLNVNDFGGTGDANGVRISDYAGMVQVSYATGGKNSSALSSASLGPGWHHYATTFDGASGEAHLFLDGQLVDTVQTGVASITSNDQLSVAGELQCQSCGGCQSDQAWFNGTVDWIRVSDSVLYTADFVPSLEPSIDSSTVVLWDMGNTTQTVSDQAGTDQNGNISGGNTLLECPQADFDGDGFEFWEDCDDLDATVTECHASCLDIITDNPQSSDGDYTIQLNGQDLLVYCDMTTEGGGWTRVAELIDSDCMSNFLSAYTGLSFSNFMASYNGEYIFSNENHSYEIGDSIFVENNQGTDLYGFNWSDFLRWDNGAGHAMDIYVNQCHSENGNFGGFFSHCANPFGPGFGFSQENYCVNAWPNRQLYWNGNPIFGPLELYLR